MLDTQIQLGKTDLTTRVSLFLKTKKKKNEELIKLRTFREINLTSQHIKGEFEISKKNAKGFLRNETWQALHASKSIKPDDFSSYFIGLKGDLYKAFKRAELKLQDAVDQLIESTYKTNFTYINSLRKRNTISKKFHRSLREMIISELHEAIDDAKNDRLNHMLKMKKEIIDFVSESGKIEKERSERFSKELRAEIFAITR